jgi:hypothetical protein
MSVRVKPSLPAVAFFAAAISLPTLAPNGAHAADTCLTAPKGPAPQGSHWYYRVERPSQRKCWRLVEKDRKDKATAARTAQPAPDDETQATPPPTKPAERPAETEAKPAPTPVMPTPVIKTLVTRNVSNTNDTAPLPPSEQSANTVPGADTPAPVPQAATSAQPPAALDQPFRQPVAASASTDASSPDGAPTWGQLFGAIALLGFLTSAAFLIMHMVRRRMDVMNTVGDADAASDETPATTPASEPTFAPLPPMALAAREDDVDQALRRFARNVKRHAA